MVTVVHTSNADRTTGSLYITIQGTHGTGKTGKTGKMAKKNPCQGRHREFGNFVQTQGILFSQVVNVLILKVKDIAIVAAKKKKKKKIIFFPEAG